MKLFILNTIAGLLFCTSTFAQQTIYKTPALEIDSIAANTYVHRTFLSTKEWGKVPCNGAIFVDNGEAIVFDTPPTDSVSIQLISWIKNHTRASIKAIVVNHSHDDCLGGLAVFHCAGVPSYSSVLTRQLAQKDTQNKPTVPQHDFTKTLKLKIGKTTIVNYYPGEGHTHDNIVSYIPSVKVLFGGCLIKALGSGKGNLAETNVAA
ncbi:MAG TPA: metallo-beta-lactamase, partial [Paludibacter sp.]|nr:metallo-beta-lactamase [Paludibacter sp.]